MSINVCDFVSFDSDGCLCACFYVCDFASFDSDVHLCPLMCVTLLVFIVLGADLTCDKNKVV